MKIKYSREGSRIFRVNYAYDVSLRDFVISAKFFPKEFRTLFAHLANMLALKKRSARGNFCRAFAGAATNLAVHLPTN